MRLPKVPLPTHHRLPFPLARADDSLRKALEGGRVFPDPAEVERSAEAFRKAHPRLTPKGLSRRFTEMIARRLAKIGGLATAAGVVPGLGTAAQIGVLTASGGLEGWLLFRNLAWLHYHVAYFHGQDVRSRDRDTELILAWGLAGQVAHRARGAATETTEVLVRGLLRRAIRGGVKNLLERVATAIAATIGAQQGPPVLGRLLPFGIGMALTAGSNYLLVRQFGRTSVGMFETEAERQEAA
jgi:hypothetical protein